MNRTDERVLALIRAGSAYGLAIRAGLPWWRRLGLYPSLQRLEDAGIIVGEFEPGPYPRRRLYRIVAG